MLTRFAPAPTGYLHLGHVANAIHVWGMARALGGRVLLRVEDHDRGRRRPEYEAALLEDLEWLGLVPDLGRMEQFRAGQTEFRQSDRETIYQQALDQLRTRHQVYACDCSRRELTAAEGSDTKRHPYGGRCRKRGLARGPGLGLRVVLPSTEVSFVDGRLGPQTQRPADQCGDLLIRDRLGNWTYQFAVTVDDLQQGIDLVIRGEDLLDSTGRQILLAAMLGRPAPPRFYHHPLILKPTGEKLSKASRDTSIRDLRRQGATASAVLGMAAHAVGLIAAPRAVDPAEVAEWFEHIPIRGPAS